MNRYCLALDLVDDPASIEAYEAHHRAVWPDIKASIREAGITDMEIYRLGTRLFMIMDTDESFSFDRKAALDTANLTVQTWETLMSQYQQALPQAQPGEKWLPMERIFQL
jgi:L-rhamnose mutarotase